MRKDKKPGMNRRQFLQTSGVATSSILLGAHSSTRLWAGGNSLNDRMGVAVIGTGGRGAFHLSMLKRLQSEGENIEIVAVCDIYRTYR